MTRAAWSRPLACVLITRCVLTLGTVVALTIGTAAAEASPRVGTAAAAATGPTTSSPLRVSIDTLAPSTIPRRGRVTLTGQITNRTKQTWTDLKVYLITSPDPITSSNDLAAAAETDEDAEIGTRRAQAGLYQEVGDLAPGASVPYRLSLRRADLGISGKPGVYWVGVHVLAGVGSTRDSIADGRARTFMPLLPARRTTAGKRDRTRLSLLVPLQAPVHRAADGRLLDTDTWRATLAADGRLDRLLRLSTGVRLPFTWVVDPALLDAVQSVAENDPQIDTSATGASSSTPAPTPSSAAQDARAWLAEFRRQVPGRTIATVPYGDLDVASVLTSSHRSLYRTALRLSADAIARYGVDDAVPVVDPPSGYLPTEALSTIDPETPVVLSQAALPDATAPVVEQSGTAPLVLTDTSAGSGGPKPNSQYAALEVRQRLVSEAAVHALSPDRGVPLVVSMPTDWNPGDAWDTSRFFRGLRTPWLRLVDLPTTVASAPADPGSDPSTLTYPLAQQAAQLPSANLQATRRLSTTGTTFGSLLSANDTVEGSISRAAMLASSTAARANPLQASTQADAATDYLRSQMARVHIEGPGFVMMSGDSGPIQVTLVNDLDQPVTVGLATSTPRADLTFSRVAPVVLGPGKRTSVRLRASSDDIGVHAVTLRVTDVDGAPTGARATFSVRTSNVSTVIWVIMAAAAALLFLAIAVRLWRRVRLRKATHGPRLGPRSEGRT